MLSLWYFSWNLVSLLSEVCIWDDESESICSFAKKSKQTIHKTWFYLVLVIVGLFSGVLFYGIFAVSSYQLCFFLDFSLSPLLLPAHFAYIGTIPSVSRPWVCFDIFSVSPEDFLALIYFFHSKLENVNNFNYSENKFQKKADFIIPMIVLSIIELCGLALSALTLIIGILFFLSYFKDMIEKEWARKGKEAVTDIYLFIFVGLAVNIFLIC